ncbi:MAG: discoidin domain-containing protein, partial [Clostridia bacterium]|nr:discoidin domain-containing protein [Clostridia bacterium]
MKKLIPIAVMLAVVVCCFAVFTTADETDEGLVAYYELSADLTDSVGSADGSLVYTPITNTDEVTETATFTDGALTIAEGSAYGVKLPVTGINGDFTVVVTISIDEDSPEWWGPVVWIGGTEQDSQNFIGLFARGSMVLQSNDPDWHYYSIDGVAFECPTGEVTYMIVYEDDTVYYYIDGVYMGSQDGMTNPWNEDDCAIYLAANYWGDPNTAASYSDLYVYSYALTTPEVERITETPTDNDLPTSYYAAYIDDGNGSWGGDENTTADKAWDGDTSTFYDSANGSDVYTGVQLTEATALSYVGVYPRDGYAYRLRFAEIQGSTDGKTWVTLYTIGAEEYAEGEWTYYAITDETAYTYYRLLTPNTNCNPAEIKLYSPSYGALVSSYTFDSDLTDSVGSADGSLVYTPITNTAEVTETATFTDGALTIAEGSAYGVKLPVTGINGDFTVVVTISIDEDSPEWWGPVVWIGGTEQDSQNFIGLFARGSMVLQSNDPDWHYYSIDGVAFECPTGEVTYMIVYEDDTVYYYIDGVYMGSQDGMTNPWNEDDCAIYLAANYWGDPNTAASYSELSVYSYALTTPEVERITETPTDNEVSSSYYEAYVDDGDGSWGSDEATTADKAWDGDTTTYYDSNSGTDAYTGVQLTEATAVTYVGVYPRDGYAYRLRFAEIQGSTDGETWVTLYTIGAEEYAEGEWTYYAITDETAYTYYRLLTPSTNCNPAEIVLYSAAESTETDDTTAADDTTTADDTTAASTSNVSLTTDDYAAYLDDGAGCWDAANGATNTADKAWDGDTSTFYDCLNGSGGY